MSTPYRVSKLTKSDKAIFVKLMSGAFAHDPLFLHLFGDSKVDSKASSSVTAFVSFLFDKSFLLHEEVWGYFENENLLGAYIVEKPHAIMLQKMKGILLILRLFPLLFQLSGSMLRHLNSYMRVTRSAAPPCAHHYLIMIGVKREEQGKGIGKALLYHLLNTVSTDMNSHGVALDTEKKENVSLYQKFGFTLNSKTHSDHLPVYCMFYQKHDLNK
ncbi:GNAT family N-acetyltransferase [Paenibacillus alvei]|uniref:GNAT family N-acetyltransferase n=1 Tax=Paenibacillus alvei TaxID=44250 RepID=A0ABT4H4M3_PAEAL|nr:GNAT family N-acetyltransferase [Paenibacillus alvei]MCY9763935.1 GNAT family N-acetyltransferase [Paenibacillus alvei]MCY9767022.1 GNAT family N-acetyltransferase [Paenibacillus alvei]